MRRHIIPADVPQMPLRQYLCRAYPAMPSWVLRETLKKKDVRVNGVKSGADAVVRAGDELTLYVEERYLSAPLQIIYEDGSLVVVDKPAGVPVDADGQGVGEDTVLARLKAMYPDPRLCHRLDTYTGGVLIAAKDAVAEAHMREAFASHALTKLYQCIVVGQPPAGEARLRAWLVKDAQASRVRVIDHPAADALPIETRYRVLAQRDGLARLEVNLITGRTHQIRAHLSHVGLPLLGDDKYGNRQANRLWKIYQPLLWCTRISLEGRSFESKPQFGGIGV
ncbi:MAG: RluA family pseudouridine synthase [Clostridia bacterium]|nr:RluA family pseudouridine synthase [Clostridia bacterium]